MNVPKATNLTLNKRRTWRNVSIFTIVVLLCGWAGQALNNAMGVPAEESLGMLLWLLSPLVATLCLRAFAGDGWYDIGIRPLFHGNVRWYLVSLLVFPVLTIIGVVIGYIFGWISMSGFSIALFLQAFIITFLPNFLKNIPEEFVWRGYLTPKLASLRLHEYKIYLIVGLVWGVWHVPYYLFFLSAADIQGFTSLSMSLFIPLTVITMIAWSIVFVEIWILTGSIWPAVLMHTVEDSFVNPIIMSSNFEMAESMEIFIHPVAGILSIILYTVVGLGLRRIRKRRSIS